MNRILFPFKASFRLCSVGTFAVVNEFQVLREALDHRTGNNLGIRRLVDGFLLAVAAQRDHDDAVHLAAVQANIRVDRDNQNLSGRLSCLYETTSEKSAIGQQFNLTVGCRDIPCTIVVRVRVESVVNRESFHHQTRAD